MPFFRRALHVGLIVACALAAGAPAYADADFEQQILSLLEQQTRIATKTRLNADYVPGIVTVLHGSALEAEGVRTVGEALTFVPGMEVILDQVGRRQTIVRGIGNTFISGTVKFMVDDMALNSAATGLAEPVFDLPIEQVERIEVVRGPGSAVHGEYAYAGVVNVITYQEGRRAYARAGRYGQRGGGLLLDHRFGNDLRLSLNLAGWRTDGADHWVARDYLYDNPAWAPHSNAPGRVNGERASRSAILRFGNETAALELQHFHTGAGDFWGVNEQLPPERDRIVREDTFESARLHGESNPLQGLAARWYLDWRKTADERDDAFVMNHYGFDFYHDRDYEEERRQAGLELEWRPGGSHRWLLGASRAEIAVRESTDAFNGAVYEIIPDDMSRRIASTWLQDEVELSEAVTVTAGLRYDEYSDAGESLTERLAAVWHASGRDLFKIQYATAFRPPSFTEMLFASDLEAAEIDTWELGYIRRNPQSLFRATLFHSDLERLIVLNTEVEPGVFENAEAAVSRGVELEAEARLTRSVRLDASLSYVDTEEEGSGKPLAGAVEWMGHLGLSYRPVAEREWTLVYRHVGEYQREAADWRAPASGHDVVDLTVNLYHLFTPGLTLRAGIRNLTDAEVVNPAMLQPEEDGLHAGSDLQRDGRTYWGQVSYTF